MSDMGDIYRCMRRSNQAKRAKRLAIAIDGDDGGWNRHTQYYWWRTVGGEKLDFWPSGNRWRWKGRSYRGDLNAVMRFIAKLDGAI